jgi:Leucine-rich repeat (LRR) protein
MKLRTVDGKFGECLILDRPWLSGFADFMRERNIVEINVSPGIKSLSFLREIPFVRGLKLFVHKIDDYSAIETLSDLRSLYDAYGFDNDLLDLTKLPQLENLRSVWREGIRSLFDCKQLTSLYLERYNGRTLDKFRTLASLRELYIVSYTVEALDGICDIRNLEKLGLYYMRRLTTLEGLKCVSGLKHLDIEATTKLGNIEPIASLTNLTHLKLTGCGDIASLRPLIGLKKLQWVTFFENTRIVDGDLSILVGIPNVSFLNRRHYSHRAEQFSFNSVG